VYPTPFDYLGAASWQEAVDLLVRHGDDAKVLAGGQSLIPLMSLRLAAPRYIVDVNGAEPARVREVDGRFEISALTRHFELERSPELRRGCPMLAEAAGLVGNIRVRHRGTIGGSLAHADPAAELPCVVLALGGTIRTLGSGGERRIDANSFFESYFTTALHADEVVVGVEVPALAERSGHAFIELVRRASDFALVEVAAAVQLEPSGDACRDVRLAVGGIGERPVELSEPARVLLGEPIDERRAVDAAAAVAASTRPRDDISASSGYRRELVRVLTKRALLRAHARALGKAG
jgi:CO/xanthine dehydrogenase FAD-binding subunit